MKHVILSFGRESVGGGSHWSRGHECYMVSEGVSVFPRHRGDRMSSPLGFTSWMQSDGNPVFPHATEKVKDAAFDDGGRWRGGVGMCAL